MKKHSRIKKLTAEERKRLKLDQWPSTMYNIKHQNTSHNDVYTSLDDFVVSKIKNRKTTRGNP